MVIVAIFSTNNKMQDETSNENKVERKWPHCPESFSFGRRLIFFD